VLNSNISNRLGISTMPNAVIYSKAAQDLYRLAQERQKPDAERELGYQERDLKMWQGRLKRLDTSFAPTVDLALWSQQLTVYLQQKTYFADQSVG
jgi:hypothetical protein